MDVFCSDSGLTLLKMICFQNTYHSFKESVVVVVVHEICVKNFKGFRNIEIKGMAPITLLGGRNCVGKTAVLEALFLFFSRYSPIAFLQQLGFRSMNFQKELSEEIWRHLFYQFDMQKVIEIDIVRDLEGRAIQKEHLELSYIKEHNTQVILADEDIPENQTSNILGPIPAIKLAYRNDESKHEHFAMMRGRNIGMEYKDRLPEEVQSVIFLGTRNTDDDAERLSNIDRLNRKDIVIRTLQIIDERVRDVSVIVENGQGVIYADIGLARKIPVRLMGDGIGRVLSFILRIIELEGGVVFIDEIENGIHYSVLHDFWKKIGSIAREFRCQIIATTHSYECIKALADYSAGMEDSSDDCAYFRLEQRAEGVGGAERFSGNEMSLATRSDMEVR